MAIQKGSLFHSFAALTAKLFSYNDKSVPLTFGKGLTMAFSIDFVFVFTKLRFMTLGAQLYFIFQTKQRVNFSRLLCKDKISSFLAFPSNSSLLNS